MTDYNQDLPTLFPLEPVPEKPEEPEPEQDQGLYEGHPILL